jgi:hypothetical protein
VGWSAFAATSLPTRVFYSVLSLGGVVLVLAAALLGLPRLDRTRLALIAGAAAAVLAINQVAGLWCSAILCLSAG